MRTLLSEVHNVHLHNWMGLIAAGYVNGAVKFKRKPRPGPKGRPSLLVSPAMWAVWDAVLWSVERTHFPVVKLLHFQLHTTFCDAVVPTVIIG